MGRERDKKQWQAKGAYAAAGAYSSLLAKQQEWQSSSVCAMRDPLSRTKVVVRRLPPTLSEDALVSRIQTRFARPYLWMLFRPGKSTHRNQIHSRAYIEFERPEDVLAFHEDFHGHVFVNEKGSQYKAMVEYAPYQRVPDLRVKKDGREGSILRDPDYLEFVDTLGKAAELLPSADVQLERPGSSREGVIVTPLMEYVRQKRAAKSAQRAAKAGFRAGSIMGPPPSGFVIQKRGDKGKAVPPADAKDSPTYVRREHKKREFKEKKQNREAGDENGHYKEADETPAGEGDPKPVDSDALRHTRRPIKDKTDSGYNSRGRPPVSPGQSPSTYKHSGYRASKLQAARQSVAEADSSATTDGRRLRNKDRPDRPVWTPRRRLDSMDSEGDPGDVKCDTRPRLGSDLDNETDGRNGAVENGAFRRKGPRDSEHVAAKRGGAASTPFGCTEKQVWVAVQKTG
ncbi:regulator of nonsense transcripts UPF3 [Selaginella moellendorffii]|uniref:regulator of nonsense transcripts UPF3 n=1 Tax=Selaginella moellendorffii TaxID=88036 RepID=UPI000D1CE0A0|nr:regulator of nonsense transcripts UPF3 [Selaginella moellendorffii]|eukprot:XP_024544994.1 regulator of nonsense transcripts UPF3 [Selaginella moellendorffii]